MLCSVLCEPLAGLENQGLGLAEAAGLAPAICSIDPRGIWEKLPARIWPNPMRCVTGLAGLGDGLVIAVGGTAGAVAAALRAKHKRVVVQVQNPRMDLARFDLVVANRHDEIAGPNVLVTRTALHRATPERLADARREWEGRLATPSRRLVAVLLGGPNGRFRFDDTVAHRLAADLAAMIGREQVAVAVTPSRRTPPSVVAILHAALTPLGATIWDGVGENPYFGMLACADIIVVTSDSVSMVSEAVATAAPVLVVTLPGRSRRIALFLDGLLQDGRIRLFDGRLVCYDARPLDDTRQAAHDMRRRLGF